MKKAANSIRLASSPDWLPASLRDRKGCVRIQFRFSLSEALVLRRRKFIPPSVWASRHRVVTYGPLAGSLWDHIFMPHLRGIMDAFVWPSVREIGNCKAPQTGSSASMETLMGYVADMDPGPCLVVYPDRETASKRSMDYLQDVFRLSPRLSGLLTGTDEDMARMRIKLKTMLIYLGWAGSATSIANVSVRYLWLDEIDKYPDTPSVREAGTVDLVLERVRAFRYNSKVFFNSTPTIEAGPIWQFMQRANAVFDYYAKCPDCGRAQPMEFKRIRWPEGERDPMVIKDGRLANYVCAECGSAWDDYARDTAVRSGHWRERSSGLELMAHLKKENPERICFHSPSWISPLVSLSEVASAFLEGLHDRNKLKYFQTQHAAEPWVDYHAERAEDRILALRDARPEGLVPAGNQTACLVAGVDTQDDGFFYDIWAVAAGPSIEAWQIRYGFVTTQEALIAALFGAHYLDAEGTEYPVRLAVQDAMGHRTAEVYDMARLYPGRLLPSKGHQRKVSPVTWSRIDCYPGTSKPIPGGLRLVNIDTTYFKNALASKLEINPSDMGALHLHSATDYSYATQMCAEYTDEKGVWQCPPGRANHYWDCAVLILAAIEILGVKFWRPAAQQVSAGIIKRPAEVNPYTGGRRIFGA